MKHWQVKELQRVFNGFENKLIKIINFQAFGSDSFILKKFPLDLSILQNRMKFVKISATKLRVNSHNKAHTINASSCTYFRRAKREGRNEDRLLL